MDYGMGRVILGITHYAKWAELKESDPAAASDKYSAHSTAPKT
ncbi:hypothetical protein SBBP2_890012 [Burkholderiales bacterium]|jgi:hypothetical protein|nr:hypothetical protein SBBP2_890012 [Burkholderiales bacterium]